MMTHAVFSRLTGARALLSRFRRDLHGGISPIFVFAMIPILALTGTAVDYSRANAARTSLQAALDATALTLSKEAVVLDDTTLKTKATQYSNSNFSSTEAKSIIVTPTFTTPQSGSFNLVVTANATVDLLQFGPAGVQHGLVEYATLGVEALDRIPHRTFTNFMASHHEFVPVGQV